MDFIVGKLSEIESTAESIVEHAEAQKPVMEKEIQDKRNLFDRELEQKTQDKLASIRSELNRQVEKILEEQREKNRSCIDALMQDYEENHTIYAQEIIRHMTEV